MGSSSSTEKGVKATAVSDANKAKSDNENASKANNANRRQQSVLDKDSSKKDKTPKDETDELHCASDELVDTNHGLVTGVKDVKCVEETADTTAPRKPAIAIDIGTTYTGFALALGDSIYTASHGNSLPSDRVPSVILLDSGMNFMAYGQEAQRMFGSMEPAQQEQCFYIDGFKMELYSSVKLTKSSKLFDSKGREVNAMNVFVLALKYLQKIATSLVKLVALNIDSEQVQWMVTIPAIWNDGARQFMREAATRAGIHNVRLVLEPEAASLFCRENKIFSTGKAIEKLPVGHKYILADLGGGTADICVHEVLKDKKLRELHRATGGAYGGTQVDKAYCEFFETLFGPVVWTQFREKHFDVFIEMMKDFERRKETFSGTETDVVVVIEQALLRTLETQFNLSRNSVINSLQFGKSVKFNENTNRLTISKDLMESFFRPTVLKIVELIKGILKACDMSKTTTLMLVGGFAESPYLRKVIAKECSSLQLILHRDTRLAVLKGAVMMANEPTDAVQRRARFTYGFYAKNKFVEGHHPSDLKVFIGGVAYCDKVFDKIVEVGQLVNVGQPFTSRGYNTAQEELKHMDRHTTLYRSTRKNPEYCIDEEDCVEVGVIVCKPPPTGWPDFAEIETQLVFGETELTVREINMGTNEEYQAQMDFL